MRLILVSLGAFLSAAVPHASAAQGTTEAYLDRTAESLHIAAMASRARLDDSVLQYTAKVRQRIGVALRTPLKDRTLYRVEAAHRVFWNRDGDRLVQVLAQREQTLDGVDVDDVEESLFDGAFDPMDDRLLFGLASRDDDLGDRDGDDFWFEHPLYPEYRDGYRFSSGDTLTLSLPDGQRVQAIELRVVPTFADVHRMSGSLWIEPRTGALVRAVYRLSDTFDAMRDIADLREEEEQGSFRFVPGLFTPWTADIRLIAVDYSLWDFDVWLPRSLRAEGTVAAGILKVPLAIDVGYEMEDVTTRDGLAAESGEAHVEQVHFRTRREAMAYLNRLVFGDSVPYVVDPDVRRDGAQRVTLLVPEDPSVLLRSPDLPPPVWRDAPGFATRADLGVYADALAALPVPPLPQVPTTFRWGFQRPDLLRYNRVEALSIGARGQIRPNTPEGPVSLTLTGRLGVADLHPNASLEVAEETLDRRVTLRGYHELAPVDERGRHLEIGNSLLAATVGRDDGDYYRRSGVSLEWRPPDARRRSYRVSSWAEFHRPASVETDFALFRVASDGWSFRPNILADRGWEFGGAIDLTPYWGSDPNLVQGGLDLTLQGAAGDFEYARTALVGRLVAPLPARFRVGLEAGVGTTWGSPSVQRLWTVGGPSSLRGYDPRARVGTSYGRARVELARGYPFGRISLFSDLGWAGDRGAIRWDDALYSIGTGLSILDGLIRLDGAWGLVAPRDFRLDFYLDQLL